MGLLSESVTFYENCTLQSVACYLFIIFEMAVGLYFMQRTEMSCDLKFYTKKQNKRPTLLGGSRIVDHAIADNKPWNRSFVVTLPKESEVIFSLFHCSLILWYT